ncbi:MAG TPA: serine protein kinase RIO [Planctomycetes bacterium]|nr:serine protein kinase RIO [Planctomycetota bacterium]
MLIPDRLRSMIDDGFVRRIIRPLKSGKEAEVFVVETEDGICAAKVYKEAHRRNFRQRQDYVEGRRSGDTRRDRAIDSGSRFGQAQREAAWQTAESDTMRRLNAAGIRIPRLRQLGDGVLLMDLVTGADGDPAPQLATQHYQRDEAKHWHYQLVHEVSRMLCAGVVHGDLSEYNILHATNGPVIIDFPQATDAARNSNAKRLLLRDVNNLTRFFSRFAPELRRSEYGQEMWLLHEQTALKPDTRLTGRYTAARGAVDAQIVLREIEAAKRDAAKRAEIRAARGLPPLPVRRP